MPKFERDVEINAPVEKVWQMLTDPNHWTEWFPGMESVANVSSLSQGSTFDWTRAGKTGRARIEQMDPMKQFEVITQVGDDKDSHLFKLHPSGGFLGLAHDETTIHYVYDTLMGGGILGDFVAGGNPVDALKVKNAMNNLRKLVERV